MRRLLALLILFAAAPLPAAQPPLSPAAAVGQAVAERAGAEGAALQRLYAAAALLWFADGRPSPQAQQALDLLQQAESHGLAPADYDPAGLARRLALASAPAPLAEQARADVALSAALLRFLAHLHAGRVDPRRLGVRLRTRPPVDWPAEVLSALFQDRLPALEARATPAVPMYARLRDALARYRHLAGAPPPALSPLRKLEPGQPYPALAALQERLAAEGDLAPGAPLPPRYEGELVAAVKRFQLRHGLEEDGVIGRATFAALATPLVQRVRQLELGMERLRWLVPTRAPRLVLINIPAFRLLGFRSGPEGITLPAAMNVIVGRAVDTETPLFEEDMLWIEFNPYWNVPPSIARDEIVPRLRRDPGYLARQGMEFVAAGSGRVASTTAGPVELEAVLRGELRIRQRPGPQNALGAVRFVLPNSMNVYLHHTPSVALFRRARRDFSHGCIRVEDPVALARFVLEDQPQWSEARIREAMAGAEQRTVRLATPVPVVIFYTTAVVGRDGKAHFLPDIYGHDRRLQARLEALRPPPP